MSKPVAIITGATGGMGLASARLFAQDHHVVLCDLSLDRLDALAKLLRQKGAAVSTQVTNISRKADVTALVELGSRLGSIGALIHTAGLSPMMTDGKSIYEVNLRGTELMLAEITPYMHDGAVAVLVASQAGTFAEQHSCRALNQVLEHSLSDDFYQQLEQFEAASELRQAYGFSKLGVQLLAQKYAPVWGAQNARVVSLSPGIIDTPMGQFENERQPIMKTLLETTPLARMGIADEIANTVRFLCSPDASFITGIDLLVDGGATHASLRAVASGELELPDGRTLE
ncbi:MAG: SDR family oxidoreductase [Pseudomonadales bacterium]